MNKEEKQLKSTRDQLLAELKECNDKLDAIKAQEGKEAEIKRNYHMNYVEPKYEINWKGYAEALEKCLYSITCDANQLLSLQINNYISEAKIANRHKVPVDPSKLWNCPKCGESNVLYIGDYGSNEFDREYAVTCSQCDFIGPTISDYGEAWCEFKYWLRKKGYLKNVERGLEGHSK